ncbi:hypothetical protein HanXRQr2_Chr15g0708681 [Helianthus annuus]|uniref:Uncharacterized protein n=1 Tax=Helianthus annuus TaxID=4232 RepID=A0A9K3H4H4_HELAN|nr:hypothetical protein HanXRQr2_Chr15g0708681 [Helianthus annuus]KAJ0832571.1 hypothetical protein HanPSC8_Chr15g0680251 [Helianthus annuus]
MCMLYIHNYKRNLYEIVINKLRVLHYLPYSCTLSCSTSSGFARKHAKPCL